jgi:hypothetical protein
MEEEKALSPLPQDISIQVVIWHEADYFTFDEPEESLDLAPNKTEL